MEEFFYKNHIYLLHVMIPEKEFRNHFFSTSKDANRLQKKKQLIDGESLFSSILKNDSNSDLDAEADDFDTSESPDSSSLNVGIALSKVSPKDSNIKQSFAPSYLQKFYPLFYFVH